MNLSAEIIVFNAFIHTIQIGSAFENLQAEDVYRKEYIVRKPYVCNDRVHYVINPNKLYGTDYLISDLQECIKAISFIVEDLLLIDFEWQIERVDIAIHTCADYDSLFKINCYLKEIYAKIINCSNSYRVIDDQIHNRSTVVKCYKYELEIYNKHIESGQDYWPMTRCEFRFKSLGKMKSQLWQQVIYSCVSKTKSWLESIPDFVSEIDDSQAKCLARHYEKTFRGSKNKKSNNLRTFLAQNSQYIFTSKILKSLYTAISDGVYKDWLYRYSQKGNVLELIKLSEIKAYCKLMATALFNFESFA